MTGGYPAENPLKWYSFPGASFPADQQFIEYQYPLPGAEPIHMIWSDAPCWTTCWNGGTHAIEAYRHPSIEFICTEHPWYGERLPIRRLAAAGQHEVRGGGHQLRHIERRQFNYIVYEGQCIDPIGESKSDYEIACEVAKRFGPVIYEQFTHGESVEDSIRAGFEDVGRREGV